ncbi:MAG: hypothetical protein F6K58_19835 [Symploca sp. SIO2E9]|nr:hypothetical protein [Symploca sp. SIO2E9]
MNYLIIFTSLGIVLNPQKLIEDRDSKEFIYKGVVIKFEYYPETPYSDAGWHWECFRNGEIIADSLKQYPEESEDIALNRATETIDYLLDPD